MSENQNNQSKGKMQNSPRVFADYARYHDLLYRDKDYGHLDRFPARIGDRFQICPPEAGK